jgi:hypothetical protein
MTNKEMLLCLSRFDLSMFPRNPLPIVQAKRFSLNKDGSTKPLCFIQINDLDKNNIELDECFQQLENETLYAFFPDLIDPYVECIRLDKPTVHPNLIIWSLCINICWFRVQYECSKKIIGRRFSQEQIEQLPLTGEEIFRCTEGFCPITPEEIEKKLYDYGFKLFKSWGEALVAQGGDEIMMVHSCRGSAEKDVVSEIALWSGTESNAISFITKCKEMTLRKMNHFIANTDLEQ